MGNAYLGQLAVGLEPMDGRATDSGGERVDIRVAGMAGLLLVVTACGSVSASDAGGSPSGTPVGSTSASAVDPIVVMTAGPDAMEFSGIVQVPGELFTAPATDAVVEGSVTSVRSVTASLAVGDESFPVSNVVVTIKVERASGFEGSTFTYRGFGGIASLTESMRDALLKSGKAVPENAAVELLGAGNAPQPKVGERVVVFAHHTSFDEETQTQYRLVGDAYGRFVLDDRDGRYWRAADFNGSPQSLNPDQLDVALAGAKK